MTRIWIACLLAVLLFTGGCSAPVSGPVSDTAFVLNTTATIKIYAIAGVSSGQDFIEQAQSRIAESFQLCRDYEAVFSRTAASSELYAVNERQNAVYASDGSASCTVSDELAELIALSQYYADLSEGAFDITIAPLSELWDFSAANPHVPSDADIQAALSAVDYRAVTLNGCTLTFTNPDTRLDLGAIAKGYIADRIADYLRQQEVTSATISLGGNVLCIGQRSADTPFAIGIQDPFSEQGDVILTLRAADLSIVSSGIYERCFTENGVFYHHILNPFTGYPYDNGLASVTILSASSVQADALSTTCFALGLEEGMALLDADPSVCGIFITTDGEILCSDGAEAYLQTAAQSY